MTLFVDTKVLVYANAADTRYTESCLAILEAIADGRIAGQTSVAVVEELWHLELGGRLPGLTGATQDAHELFRPLLAVTDEIVGRALSLTHDGLGANDRIHVATCLVAGIDTVVSADTAFDGVADVARLDPADGEAVARALER